MSYFEGVFLFYLMLHSPALGIYFKIVPHRLDV